MTSTATLLGTNNSSKNIMLSLVLLSSLLPLHSCRRLSAEHHHHRDRTFNIPAFQVNLTVDISPDPTSDFSSPSQLPLLDVSTTSKLKSATVSYLFDYIESILEEEYDMGDRDKFVSPLDAIDLEVSVHAKNRGAEIEGIDNDDYNYEHNHNDNDGRKTMLLVAEMAGETTFTTTTISPDYIVTQEKINVMSITAFLGSMAMNDYKARIQSILPEVLSVRVESRSKLSSFDSTKNEGDQNSGGGGGVGALGVFLLLFLFISAALLISVWLYKERQIKRYGRRSRKGHLLMDTELHSDYYEQDGEGSAPYFTGLESDGSCGSLENEPIQFIPIPARFDEVTNGRKSAKPNQQPDITPRRYVSTTSPFDLLYGAAFSHSEKTKVQLAHGMKPKQKAHRSKAPKGRQLNPLNTITEVNEEEPSESFFPQFMSTISSFIASKDPSAQKSKDDFVVFRDFPRHDGTPCIMFDGFDSQQSSKGCNRQEDDSKTPPKAAFERNCSGDDDGDEEDMSHGSSDSSGCEDDEKENIDCFVDKLENLMAARSRQYEERKKMDRELVERKKLRMEQRQREKEMLSGSRDNNDGHGELVEDLVLSSDVDSTNQDDWNLNANNKEEKAHRSDTGTFGVELTNMPPTNDKEGSKEECDVDTKEKLIVDQKEKSSIIRSQSSGVETSKITTSNLISPRDVESLHFEDVESSEMPSKEENQSVDVIIHGNDEVKKLL